MRIVPAILLFVGVCSSNAAFAQTYCGASGYCYTPQVVCQNFCPQPCQVYYSPLSVCCTPIVCYPVVEVKTLCKICPKYAYAFYPNYVSHYALYCFTDYSVEPHNYDHPSNLCSNGYCPENCNGNCTITGGTCFDPNNPPKKVAGESQGRLRREVYYQMEGAFRLTKYKKVTRKVLQFEDEQFKTRNAEVFEVTLSGPNEKDPELIYRFGHQIEHADHTKQEGIPEKPTDNQSNHVLFIKPKDDPEGEAYRVWLHTSRKGDEEPEPRPEMPTPAE